MTAKKKKQIKAFAGKLAASIVIGVISYVIVRTIINSSKRKKIDNNPDDPVSYLVQRYRGAMNPSGISWLIGTDGTDEQEIFDLALATQGRLTEVQRAYKSKFNSTLTDDLRKELSSSDYSKWYAAAL